ncbi:MAG: glycoside hydrolase family 43 protein [Pirellulaceae bacterium]|jgi:beta-xylosidase|nr:glycoside hydrolase family 43 protein [Pirellulaceae bacterium]MCU0979119.1 glycoside hydrolase family 43 protein [Pirellulaceae bacterium]
MKIPSLGVIVFATAVALLPAQGEPAEAAATGGSAYVFTYFVGNGEDGLHLLVSRDGLAWHPVNGGRAVFNAQVGSQRLMRDPCAIRGPDGRFHLVWTTGWKGRDIGYAHSPDLIQWSTAQVLAVMAHEPQAGNCWAPEVFFDDAQGEYLVYWSTTIAGRYDGHRVYRTRTKDFADLSPPELFYEPGFNVIDATLLHDAAGGRYVMVLKDERQSGKNLRVALADKAAGPFGPPSAPITGKYWCEGPAGVKVGDRWIVYFDKYTEHKYGAVASRDLKAWEDISDQVSFPPGVRHGTALAVPAEVAANLEQLK